MIINLHETDASKYQLNLCSLAVLLLTLLLAIIGVEDSIVLITISSILVIFILVLLFFLFSIVVRIIIIIKLVDASEVEAKSTATTTMRYSRLSAVLTYRCTTLVLF